MGFFQVILGRYIFNYIGGTIRWIYGSIWRSIFNQPKFSFRDYIDGSKNTKNQYFDEFGHQFNNRLIGLLFFIVVIYLFLN